MSMFSQKNNFAFYVVKLSSIELDECGLTQGLAEMIQLAMDVMNDEIS